MNTNKNKTNSINIQQTPVKVIYYIKSKIIAINQILLSSTFGSILDYFKNNIQSQTKAKLKRHYYHNNSKLDLNTPLINLIELKKNSSSSTIEYVEIYIELEEFNKSDRYNDRYNSNNYNILLQPKENPFGIYVFNSNEGILNLEQYPEKIIEKYELNKININTSAYCNSQKYLYISGGGIANNLQLKDFWIINNRKYSIIKKKMPYNKSNHSMLCAYLQNKEIIFIAGGDNNLITFYYDINLNSFIVWSNMNAINIKPALYQYKEYIYSFNSFENANNNSLYFERTNIVTGKPNWEKIIPKYDLNKINFLTFKNNNFGVSQGENDEIIILGGEEAEINILAYDPNKNSLSLGSKINMNLKINFSDKIFYSIDKAHNIALPQTLSTKKEIVVFNRIKQSIRLIDFEKYNNKKIKLKDEFDLKENSIGNIYVKAKIHERLRFDIQPEIVEAQKLTFEQKKDNKNDNEITNMEFIPDKNNDDFVRKNSYKEKKKKDIFYLSSDVVYNNYVNLLVEKYNNKK